MSVASEAIRFICLVFWVLGDGVNLICGGGEGNGDRLLFKENRGQSPFFLAWKDMTVNFIKSFTFYGLLVLFAVFLQRYGKALLDQSERLLDRRHALRQGRLYLHLRNGEFKDADEMEKAFNWNQVQLNAFANLNTEAQAPWGTVIKEMIHIMPEMAKAMNIANAAKDEKKDDKKAGGK